MQCAPHYAITLGPDVATGATNAVFFLEASMRLGLMQQLSANRPLAFIIERIDGEAICSMRQGD